MYFKSTECSIRTETLPHQTLECSHHWRRPHRCSALRQWVLDSADKRRMLMDRGRSGYWTTAAVWRSAHRRRRRGIRTAPRRAHTRIRTGKIAPTLQCRTWPSFADARGALSSCKHLESGTSELDAVQWAMRSIRFCTPLHMQKNSYENLSFNCEKLSFAYPFKYRTIIYHSSY